MLLACVALLAASTASEPIIGIITTNDGRGPSNFYGYYRISHLHLKLAPGDALRYDVYLDPRNPEAKAGIDVGFIDAGAHTRDMDIRDQHGLGSHGDTPIPDARGRWLERQFDLSVCAGRTTDCFDIMFEGDAPGRYAAFWRGLEIVHRDGSREPVANPLPPITETISANGYTDKPVMATVPARMALRDGSAAESVAYVERVGAGWRTVADMRTTAEIAAELLALEGVGADTALARLRRNLDRADPGSAGFPAVLADCRREFHLLTPLTHRFTGHLIGHGHIDAQWLWEWQGGLQAIHNTWAQALRFMKRYPDFTYTQSSTAFYRGVEEQWPEMFAEIRKRVKEGRWEIAGGRVLEADENMPGSESNARQFLLGQHYFRSRFGRTASVGWEPDTFGHTSQFPQILQLSGCPYFYHYRAGRKEPLYRWEAPDGSSVLAFDEDASGGWYGNGLSTNQFRRLASFAKKTGAKDMPWIYGVGNHGGGPTQRQIETALAWQKSDGTPLVKFDRADRTFATLAAGRMRLPTLSGELIGDAQGTFTSEAEVKHFNRASESALLTAETASTVASLFGSPYPQAELNEDWWNVLFQQHHDTMSGSGNFASYERTRIAFHGALSSAKMLTRRSLESLALRVTPKPGGANVLVYNPLGWQRSGWVEAIAPRVDEMNPFRPLDLSNIVVIAPNGKRTPFLADDVLTGQGRFFASDVPAFGYAVFHLAAGNPSTSQVTASAGGSDVSNGRLTAAVDLAAGCLDRLSFSGKSAGGRMGIGRLIQRVESNGTTAWHIGRRLDETPLVPESHELQRRPGEVSVSFRYSLTPPGSPGYTHEATTRSTVTQTFTMRDGEDAIACDLDIDWHAVSFDGRTPGLRIAFDSGDKGGAFDQQIPFGVAQRPTDGSEQAGAGWADVGGNVRLAVLNDGAGGSSVRGGVLSIGVIRSGPYPNPRPNPGEHHVRFLIFPHQGDWQAARLSQRAAEFNQPMLPIAVPYDANGAAPLVWSPLSVIGHGVLPTALKRAEDGQALILRLLNESGKAGKVDVKVPSAAGSGSWVNLIEDALGQAVKGNSFTRHLRKWEIATLKVRLEPSKS